MGEGILSQNASANLEKSPNEVAVGGGLVALPVRRPLHVGHRLEGRFHYVPGSAPHVHAT